MSPVFEIVVSLSSINFTEANAILYIMNITPRWLGFKPSRGSNVLSDGKGS